MKRATYVQKLSDLGYTITQQPDGLVVSDGFGFRCFVSDTQCLALNTAGSCELPKAEFELTLRYARTPLDKR